RPLDPDPCPCRRSGRSRGTPKRVLHQQPEAARDHLRPGEDARPLRCPCRLYRNVSLESRRPSVGAIPQPASRRTRGSCGMSTTSVPAVDLAPHLEKCFLFDATEASYEMTGLTGRIPEWVRGTYYCNGPARFLRNGRQYKHWLDGDGMILRVHFGEDGARF